MTEPRRVARPGPRSKPRRLLLAVAWTLALPLTSAALLVLGALLKHNLATRVGPATATTMTFAVVAVMLLAVPTLVAQALRQRLRTPLGRALPWALAGCSGLVLLLGLVGLPKTTRLALETHGDWMLGSSGDDSRSGFGRWVARLSGHIPRSGPARPHAVTDSSATMPAATAPVPTADLSPQDLFALRADSVVVIRSRQPLPKDDPRSRMLSSLGIRTMQSAGSGFVVDGQGLIVTNYHVVEDTSSLEVTRRDGKRFAVVELLATEKTHDLALLHIADRGGTAAPLAPDEAVAIGGRAIAIGSPLGLEYSLTDGIISAVRDIQGTHFLQMQTTIAPGSSGGPLLDPRGRVIGVNTATQGAGLNLAVHVRHVRDLLTRPRKPRKLRPYVPGPWVSSIAMKGAAMMPVSRMKLEEAVKLLAAGAEGCVDRVPEKASLTLKFARRAGPLAGRSATLETNLSRTATTCLEGNLQLTGAKVASLLDEDFASEVSAGHALLVTVGIQGVRGTKTPKAAERSLTVRFAVPRR